MRTVILGDVHLGSPLCRAALLREVLEGAHFDRLVLNGDIFDDLNFRRLSEDHWHTMQAIRTLTEEGKEVIWIRGNHDGSAEVLRHLLGVPVLEDYLFPFRGELVFVTHGDLFDDFQRSAKSLKSLRRYFYGFAIWFDVPRKTAIQLAQRSTTVFARAVDKVKRKALAEAAARGARFVVVGHTHHREEDHRDGITYLNPSSWLTRSPAYVLFDDEARSSPTLVVVEPAKHRKSGRKHVAPAAKPGEGDL